MTVNLKSKLFTTLLLFLIYFVYVNIITSIFGNSISVVFLSEFLFLVGIIYVFREKIKEDYQKIREKKIWKQVLRSILFALLLFVIYVAVGAVLTNIFPEMGVDDGNTVAIYSIYNIDTIYTIFKTLIFAAVAEELLFKESIRSIIKPNVSYVIISSVIYAFVNIMYNDLSLMITWLNMIPYLLFAILLNIIYVKNDNNICLVMMVKFFYNLIPLAVLLSGLGA